MPIGTYPQLLRDAWTISSKPLCCQYLGSRWNNDYQENLSRRICQMPQPLQVMRNTGLRIGSQSYTKLHWRHPTSGSFFQTWPLVHLLPPSSYLLRFIYPAGPFACLLPIPLAWSSSFLSLSLAYLAQEIWPPLVTGHLWVAHDHLPVDLCPSKWALVNPSLNCQPFLLFSRPPALSNCSQEWHVHCNDTLSIEGWVSEWQSSSPRITSHQRDNLWITGKSQGQARHPKLHIYERQTLLKCDLFPPWCRNGWALMAVCCFLTRILCGWCLLKMCRHPGLLFSWAFSMRVLTGYVSRAYCSRA